MLNHQLCMVISVNGDSLDLKAPGAAIDSQVLLLSDIRYAPLGLSLQLSLSVPATLLFQFVILLRHPQMTPPKHIIAAEAASMPDFIPLNRQVYSIQRLHVFTSEFVTKSISFPVLSTEQSSRNIYPQSADTPKPWPLMPRRLRMLKRQIGNQGESLPLRVPNQGRM
jgi:hypothetical protein